MKSKFNVSNLREKKRNWQLSPEKNASIRFTYYILFLFSFQNQMTSNAYLHYFISFSEMYYFQHRIFIETNLTIRNISKPGRVELPVIPFLGLNTKKMRKGKGRSGRKKNKGGGEGKGGKEKKGEERRRKGEEGKGRNWRKGEERGRTGEEEKKEERERKGGIRGKEKKRKGREERRRKGEERKGKKRKTKNK